MVVPQFSEVVRYYATTNQENTSFTVRQMEFAFDAWLAQVKKETAAAARAEALEEVIKGIVSCRKFKTGNAPLSRYDEGKNVGLVTAYNVAYDLKNTTPS
jgi:hypothetical protein